MGGRYEGLREEGTPHYSPPKGQGRVLGPRNGRDPLPPGESITWAACTAASMASCCHLVATLERQQTSPKVLGDIIPGGDPLNCSLGYKGLRTWALLSEASVCLHAP